MFCIHVTTFSEGRTSHWYVGNQSFGEFKLFMTGQSMWGDYIFDSAGVSRVLTWLYSDPSIGFRDMKVTPLNPYDPNKSKTKDY